MSKKLENLKWNSVSIDGFPTSSMSNLQGFVALEECKDYGLEKSNKQSKKRRSQNKKQKEVPTKKMKLDNGFIVENCKQVTPSLTNEKLNHEIRKSKKNKKNERNSEMRETKNDKPLLNKDKLNNKVQKRKLGENIPEVIEELTPEDMLSWAEFKLPEEILKALMESGFKNPTKIQQLTLPAAIHGRRDILGAAETGSGKTLAFGLPILTGIMKLKEKAKSGLNIYDIPYKKTSVKKKDQTTDKDNKNKQRKKKNKKIEQANAKESSEDGYGSDDETDEDVEEGSKTNDNEYIEEIEVPVRKRETASEDEGNNSDDSSNYVHLSEMLDSDDLADESDNKNDAQSSGDESANEDNLDVNNEEAEIENNEGIGCVRVVEDIEIPPHEAKRTGKPFFALILTPTRELAIQISRHLIAVAKYTGINVATIVGGMAAVKQERVLRRGPEVIVATPGRLWELISQGESHLQQIDTIKFLAIDETDRMVERGHFEELEPLLERLNADEARRGMRQNFVFSATLTMVHELPTHMRAKKVTKHGKIINRKIEKMTPEMKIKKLIQRIGMTDPKVVDITTKNLGTAETLTESRIACSLEHKDVYLYYILKRHPGRTIVFCNSIGCVKRLAQLFTLLKCRPLPLHASMPQRQRLKNLERFRDDQRGVLVATDVAARGLDIPNVDHVVHYQVPRTAENYVHRSGRTARANKEGLTILLMEPSEAHLYTKLCRTLNKTSELPTFPVTTHTFNSMSGLVSLARDVDALMLKRKRASQSQGWLDKAAKEMDMIIDDDDVQVKRVDPKIDKELRVKKRQLDSLLSKPMFPKGFSYKYPTLNDSDALLIKEEKALEAMKNSRRKLPKIKTTLNK